MKALQIYETSDGALTKRYYAELDRRGPIGVVAMNLLGIIYMSTPALKTGQIELRHSS
jgi:hypothetical protein